MKVLIMLPVHPRLIGSSALLTLLLSSLAHAQDAAPPPPVEEEPASPVVNLSLFADTYVSYNSAKSGTPAPYHRAYDNNTPYDPLADFPVLLDPATGEPLLDAAGATTPSSFANRNGFGLSFVGLDANFDTGTVGATAFLRFGPSVPIFYAADTGVAGIDSILGGYVTVKPVPELVIDAGYFGTIYGAEVAESWINFNYTRGALYYAMQPFYHFGAKAAYSINEQVTVRAMVVNGANNIVDENDAPAVGLQLALNDLGGVFDLSVGGFYETGDDSSWGIETFIDAVAVLTLGDFTLLANFDYNINRAADDTEEDVSFWGVMGTAAYSITPDIGVAFRGEYLADPDNSVWGPAGDAAAFTDAFSLVTLTGTLDLKMLPHLYLRPEFRYEMASDDIFYDTDAAPTDGWYTAILGLVATTN
jgi:hypothetical protein